MIVLKSVKAAASVSSDMPSPTETSARVIGIAMATAVPSTTSSTTMAAAKPSISLVWAEACLPFTTGPPNSTWRSESPTAARTSSSRASMLEVSTSAAGESYWTSMKATRSSSLMAPAVPA